MTRCSECGSEYLANVEECPACGGEEPVRCSRCGEPYRGGDSCPACGRVEGGRPCDSHPTAIAAGRCLICGRLVCRVCEGRSRRVSLCPEHARVGLIQGWAQIYSTASEFEAQLLRENLLAEGIDAQIFSQKDNMLSVDLGELSIVRLLVPAWQYEQAQKVIRAHMNQEGEVAFACPACGEAYEPGAELCATCGWALTARTED